jgi:hypothetical protein
LNKKCLAALFLGSFIVPNLASSQITAWVNIVQVGGQTSNMFIDVSTPVGEPACSAARILIPSGVLDADGQKRLWAAVSMALVTGQKMQFALSGCNGSYPTMIASDFWFLQKN